MIETDRLILRAWRDRDLAPFAALCTDPCGSGADRRRLARAESDALVAAMRGHWAAEGWGYGAVERRSDGAFLGMAGLSRCDFGPCVEIGWRLARPHRGRGYAAEAARGWLGFGFATLRLPEIVAFTDPAHARSRAVMRRIGMIRDPARAVDPPDLPGGRPVRRQAVYALKRDAFTPA